MDGGIKFDVSANTAKFDADMARVGNVATRTSDKVRQAFSGLGGLLAGGAVLGGLKTIMDDFDKVAKVATRFGASAEDIQRVSVAADLAGVSIDTVARVLTKMSVAASEASTGNEAMAEAFKRAGINAEQFKNAGLEEQLVMLSEAFNRARGDADATNQVIELMGTRAAGQMIPLIDNTAALREEMAGVSVASDETVRRIEAANDRMTRFFNDLKVGAAWGIGLFTDSMEMWGSWFAGQGFKTIRELEEIELRAQAIAQLTREGLLGGNDAENTRLIAERMEHIQNKLKGNKDLTGLINEDLATANNLEKEKTSQLERQQELLQQQEARRKEAIRDAQMEVDLIEAKLRGDKARVAALEEQRDFERTLEQTGSFETAANVAATKAAERAAQQGASGGGIGSSGGGVGISGGGRTAMEALQDRAKTDATTLADLMRLQNETNKMRNRAANLREQGKFSSSAREELRADAREQRRAEEAMRRQQMMDMFGARNLGDATRNFETDSRRAGMSTDEALRRMGINRNLGEGTRDALKRFFDQQSMPEEQRKSRERGGMGQDQGGGGKTDKPTSNLATETTLNQLLQEVIKRLPQNIMTAR